MKAIVYVIGLTGGIGAGKSEVAALLRSLGARVIDADRLGHEAYRSGTEGWRSVVEAFGPGVLGADGEIDRQRLGALVFSDAEALDRLSRTIHPVIRGLVEKQLEAWRSDGATVALVEAAVLFQAGWDTLVDEVWLVTAPPEQVLDRLQQTRRMTAEEARKRIAANAPPRDKADVVIDNSGSMEQLAERVRQLWVTRILSRGQIST